LEKGPEGKKRSSLKGGADRFVLMANSLKASIQFHGGGGERGDLLRLAANARKKGEWKGKHQSKRRKGGEGNKKGNKSFLDKGAGTCGGGRPRADFGILRSKSRTGGPCLGGEGRRGGGRAEGAGEPRVEKKKTTALIGRRPQIRYF